MILREQVGVFQLDSPTHPPTSLNAGRSQIAGLWAVGPIALLKSPSVGLFCSSTCPGSIILKTFDVITRLRDEGRVLIAGFHSAMEWECLGILLRGNQPVIWVPARSIVGMRLKPELQPAFKDGRLLIISPFAPVPAHTRVTATLAERRNRFVGNLADEVFVAHAHTGSKTAELCHELLSGGGKRVYTVSDPANENLVSIGAIPWDAKAVSDR